MIVKGTVSLALWKIEEEILTYRTLEDAIYEVHGVGDIR
jgi:hypothetical protein